VQGAIRHTAVIPIAGDQLTNDIAIALRTSTQDAEDIKIRYGVALQQLADPEDMIEVPGVGDRPSTQLSRQTLAGFIQPRVEEIFQKVQEELQRSGKERLLRAGIVLTGGAAQMPGMTELGEEIFHNDREAGDAALRRQPARLRAQSALLHGDGFVAGRGGAAPAGHEGAKPEELRAGSGADAGVVHQEFLRWLVFSGGENV
jgi:cell division ATPase FtsA